MPISKEDSARILAQKHYETDCGLKAVMWYTGASESEDNTREPIKLLEVNSATVSSGVMPLHFAALPSMGIPYASVIVQVTPDEFKLIESKELALPKNWLVRKELPKTVCTTAANE